MPEVLGKYLQVTTMPSSLPSPFTEASKKCPVYIAFRSTDTVLWQPSQIDRSISHEPPLFPSSYHTHANIKHNSRRNQRCQDTPDLPSAKVKSENHSQSIKDMKKEKRGKRN